MKKDKLFLVGNAHLDPVWQWQWQEGSMEAKATIRSALDRMKEFPEFKFVCSSASVYKWVEEFAPEMFEEVKQRIAEGRFVIVGGWFVQPDCNLPSGEAFARQSLYSQRYFKETFGKTAKVGYNVDSFGHCATLPKILKKSGMDSYIFMRPSPTEKEMDSDVFNWTSDDGSTVLTYRILDPYCAKFTCAEELEERVEYLEKESKTNFSELPLFYGVGNHGGGPTIRHLEVLREYAEKHAEKEMIYSDLSDFFGDVANEDIPEYKGDLQHHASGCYSAINKIKNDVRRSEVNLVAAESYNTLAAKLCGKGYKNERFKEAFENVCFCHFHDSLDGCSIKEVYDDAADMLGFAKQIAAVEENNALQSISWKINTKDNTLGQPVVVFNPHPFDAEQIIQINGQFNVVKDCKGNVVPSQLVFSTVNECYNRKDTIFSAKVKALGYSVYYVSDGFTTSWEERPKEIEHEKSATCAFLPETLESANNHDAVTLQNEFLTVKFERYSGYITEIYDSEKEQNLITDRAAVPVVIDEYYHDTWSHGKNFFTDEMARFSDAKVTVLENGPVRATVKVVSRYNNSTLTQYFSLVSGGKKLQVRAFVDWHEKYKMLKIKWPMAVENPKAFYEIPFGIIERPADGEEEPGINWTAVKGTNGGFALVNNNTYSSSVKDGTIYHTVVRGTIYGDHGGPRTEESEFSAQGRFDFSYEIMPLCDNWSSVIKEGKLLNKGFTNILDTWHEGTLQNTPYGSLECDSDNVFVSAVKRSEDNTGLILRVYEAEGKETNFSLKGDLLPKEICDTISPFAVETYFLKDGTNEWEKVLFTEYAE